MLENRRYLKNYRQNKLYFFGKSEKKNGMKDGWKENSTGNENEMEPPAVLLLPLFSRTFFSRNSSRSGSSFTKMSPQKKKKTCQMQKKGKNKCGEF